MTRGAYYNEHDPFAAVWLRELIKAGAIAPGDVDERNIQDVSAQDLAGYRQCHWFAGIGVWSYALRQAGWPDDRAVWTGSCPCQPFSAAGKGEGHADPRHLWPEWFRLIRECRPERIFGEQVEAAIRHGWLDLVSTDLEGEGYAVGAAVVGAHSVGAPHRRQRLYFCADAEHAQRQPKQEIDSQAHGRDGLGWSGDAGERPDAEHDGHHRPDGAQTIAHSYQPGVGILDGDGQPCFGSHAEVNRHEGQPVRGNGESAQRIAEVGGAGDLRDTDTIRLQGFSEGCLGSEGRETAERPTRLSGGTIRAHANHIGATRGFWRDCDWWYGRDGKYRPIEPGLQPLAHGAPNRVGRLRGYGNAIVAPQAQAFITAAMEVLQ